MSSNTSSPQSSQNLQVELARGRGDLLAVTFVLVACAVAGLQVGCESRYSLTAQDFVVSMSRASYILMVQPESSGGLFPGSVEVLLDGVAVAGTRITPPTEFEYYEDVPLLRAEGDLSPPAPGRHTLSLRVTQQHTSPYVYRISGRVDLVWQHGNSSNAARWDQERVVLATGEAWTGEFVVPER
jgi:hypothetical protein